MTFREQTGLGSNPSPHSFTLTRTEVIAAHTYYNPVLTAPWPYLILIPHRDGGIILCYDYAHLADEKMEIRVVKFLSFSIGCSH